MLRWNQSKNTVGQLCPTVTSKKGRNTMTLQKESKFKVVVDCDVEVENVDMSTVLAKVGKHLKDIPYVTRINMVEIVSYDTINENRQ